MASNYKLVAKLKLLQRSGHKLILISHEQLNRRCLNTARCRTNMHVTDKVTSTQWINPHKEMTVNDVSKYLIRKMTSDIMLLHMRYACSRLKWRAHATH